MKGSEACCAFSSKYSLYIPHGSDESKFAKRTQEKLYNFISHMVQMKALPASQKIAHGNTFISHMVQMKVGHFTVDVVLFENFISHMVQMKARPAFLVLIILINFISHMVQMKDTDKKA